jgi:hypothetical protein
MKAAKHLLLFLLCLGCVCALRLVWAGHFVRELNRVVVEASRDQSREMEAVWRRQAFAPFSAAPAVSAMFKKVQLPPTSFTEAQRAKLERRLLEVLRYFEQPTFDEYYRLKTAGLRWKFDPDGRARGLLARSGAEGSIKPTPAEARESVRRIWDQAHAGSLVCLPRITAICLDSIAGVTTHANSAKALLTGEVKRGFTVAVEATDPGFVYGSVEAPVEPILFEMSFLARANGSEDAGPMYISLLWVEADQEWALNRLMTDRWLHIRTIF